MLPLLMDMRSRKVVVFGGGAVGLRKATFFAKEAEVAVVSRSFAEGFRSLPLRTVEGDIGEEMEGWIAWADLVVAATDDPVLNSLIESKAAAANRPCNNADGVSTFLIPSLVERRNFLVAVSTEGRSPAMSKFLRLKLEGLLDDVHSTMIDLQMELREEAKARIPDQRRREEYLWSVLEDEAIWQALSADHRKAGEMARKRMVEFLE